MGTVKQKWREGSERSRQETSRPHSSWPRHNDCWAVIHRENQPLTLRKQQAPKAPLPAMSRTVFNSTGCIAPVLFLQGKEHSHAFPSAASPNLKLQQMEERTLSASKCQEKSTRCTGSTTLLCCCTFLLDMFRVGEEKSWVCGVHLCSCSNIFIFTGTIVGMHTATHAAVCKF